MGYVRFFYSVCLLLFPCAIFATEIAGLRPEPLLSRSTPSYQAYDAFLQKTVNQKGEVDYRKVVAQRETLRFIVQDFLRIDPETLSSPEEKLAYYINVYNAVTLYQVSLYYPLKSVYYDFPQGKFFKTTFPLAGKPTTLDELENQIIRPKFKNPYIHFALNCASRSCPILENRAWRASGLEQRLKAAARRYLNNPHYARYEAAHNTLWLSELFQWYQVDFGNLIVFYNTVTKKNVPATAQVKFLPYDWSLNEKTP